MDSPVYSGRVDSSVYLYRPWEGVAGGRARVRVMSGEVTLPDSSELVKPNLNERH